MSILLVILAITVIIFIGNKLWCFWCRNKVCLVGKTAIVTGGCSGIGFQATLALAARGCRVIIADVADVEKAAEDIKEQSHNPNIIGMKLDLQSFESVRKFAKAVIQSESKLDILVCNAGIGNVRQRTITKDGLDRTMQINYFGHFLLTHLLLDLLKKSSPSRIIFTSSVMSFVSDLTLDKLTPELDYYSKLLTKWNTGVYGNSKLCMAAAAKLFSQKLKGTGVTANAFHPGGVQTPLYNSTIKNEGNYLAILLLGLVYLYGKTPEQGAQTLVHLATSDELKNTTGGFFYEGLRIPGPQKLTKDFCDKLWDASIELTKLQPNEIQC